MVQILSLLYLSAATLGEITFYLLCTVTFYTMGAAHDILMRMIEIGSI